MKKVQWIEFINNIKRNKVPFFAIMIFVMFGFAIYTGLGWSGKALMHSVTAEQDAGKMADLELFFPYGFNDQDLEILRQVEGVSDIEGTYSCFQSFEYQKETHVAKLIMIQESINHLTQIEGKLPTKKDEIALEKNWAKDNGFDIGDTICFVQDSDEKPAFLHRLGEKPETTFEDSREEGLVYLNERVFTVTCLAESPAYISAISATYESSPITCANADCIMFADRLAFNEKSFPGYSSALICSRNTANLVSGSEDYNDVIEQLKERVIPVAENLAHKKADRLNAVLSNVGKENKASSNMPKNDSAGVIALTRENNVSLLMVKVVSDMFKTIKYNMAIPFLIISILVSYSTISRMIYKDIRCVGTKKAEGFRDESIIFGYAFFSLAAALLGLLLGLLISRFIIEQLFLKVLKRTFLFERIVWHFSLGESVLIGGLQLGSILLSAYIAGHRTVHSPVMNLLSGNIQSDSQERFYENTAVWKRISLLSKSTVYNFFNDKRRVIATLIGVAGCTALVICGMSLMLSVSNSFDYHYSQLQACRQVVYFNPNSESAQKDIRETLEENNIRCTPVLYSSVRLSAPNGKNMVALLAVSDSNFDGLMKIRTLNGVDREPTDEGAWISCAFAQKYGINDKNGRIIFTDVLNQYYDVPCRGVYEYYLQNPRIVMSNEAYEKEFSKEPLPNAFLVDPGKLDKKALNDILADIPGFISVYDQYESMKDAFGIIELVASTIAVVYVILSAMMAVFILLDLFVMFVEEKKRELITLMINGYHPHYAKQYIYSDTIFLTVIGIALGVIFGIVLSIWNVNMLTSDVSYYLHRISIASCIGAAVYTAFLTAVMCMIAMKRIDKFKLADIV